ncbi:RNA polymerase III subunit C82 [Teratosphaeriaceae sp. CCFEE 6253]|nr:RNA polymerase III subunit C82 [Teratosphaeriaceae sp. CCFEE 6253]
MHDPDSLRGMRRLTSTAGRTSRNCAPSSSRTTWATCPRYTFLAGEKRRWLGLTASEQIFATLAEHGRLTAPTLALLTTIPLRRARTGLASLLEEQLILHHAAEDDAPTFYSVSWRNAYSLARHSNVVALVTDRHGESAGQVVKNILQLGQARVGDLADAYNLSPTSKRDSGVDTAANHVMEGGMTNGTSKSHAARPSVNQHVTTANELHSILRTLLRAGVLAKASPRSTMPVSDLQEQLEETVISEQFPDRKVTGPKKSQLFSLAVHDLKRRWREEDAFSEHDGYGSKGSLKRPVHHVTGPNKRVKVNGNLTNGHATNVDEEPVSKLSDDLIVSVDFTRCTLGLRSQRLQQLAKRLLGGGTGAVYDAVLRCIEPKIRAVRTERDNIDPGDDPDPDRHLPSCTVTEIADMLDPAVDLGSSIKGVGNSKPLANGTSKKGKKHVDSEFADIGIKQELSDSDDEPTTNGLSSYRAHAKRAKMVEAHLMLLEEHPKAFCKRARPGSNSQEWRVNFDFLTDGLVQADLDSTILARFGKKALRIIRLLRERGKLEEKQVGSLAMMRIRDVRMTLTELQFAGLVDAQELPKDNQRQPSRTTYLWFFEPPRVQSLVLQQTYKAMSRTLQRVKVERQGFRAVIEKAERTDVKGYEETKLEQGDKALLRQWREMEERMLAQVARMDEVVGVLRDCGGRDVGLDT